MNFKQYFSTPALPLNFAQYFRHLQIFFFALLAGQILICAVLYFVYQPQEGISPFQQDWVLKAWPFALVALMVVGFFLNRRILASANEKNRLADKLATYRIASIQKWAMTEGGTLISALLFFETGNQQYLNLAGVAIAYFATQFPSRQHLTEVLDLSANDQATLDDPNAIVFESSQ
ncbi:MAG: hypothetical protein JNM22_02160 [Saprospiraceae bacterium]|nr:hypothetical protein [Saprospiraceae bacterium]